MASRLRPRRVDDKELTATVLELRDLIKQRSELTALLTQLQTKIGEKKDAVEAVLQDRLRF